MLQDREVYQGSPVTNRGDPRWELRVPDLNSLAIQAIRRAYIKRAYQGCGHGSFCRLK